MNLSPIKTAWEFKEKSLQTKQTESSFRATWQNGEHRHNSRHNKKNTEQDASNIEHGKGLEYF